MKVWCSGKGLSKTERYRIGDHENGSSGGHAKGQCNYVRGGHKMETATTIISDSISTRQDKTIHQTDTVSFICRTVYYLKLS